MSRFLDEAKRLRAITEVHYNCGQSVILPFCEDLNIDKDLAFKFAANFNLGLKRGAACGAITAGIVVLGLYGVNDPATISQYYQKISNNHEGMLECNALLKANADKGLERKPHCDAMVYEAILTVEEILKEKGIL